MTHRNQLYGKIHLAAKRLGLDDTTYRDVIERVAGHRSTMHCTEAQLVAVVEEMKRLGFDDKPRQPKRAGSRRLAGGEQQGKIRALWLSLWHMAEIDNPAEDALAAWVKSVTGRDALQWLEPKDANKAIEGLKSWCARKGFTVPDTSEDGGLEAGRELCRVIWSKLGDLGAVSITHRWALNAWVSNRIAGNACTLEQLDAPQLVRAAEGLGKWLRSKKATTGAAAS